MNSFEENTVESATNAIYNRLKTYRPYLSEESRMVLVKKHMQKDYGVILTDEELNEIMQKIAQPEKSVSKKPILIKRDTTEFNHASQNMVPEDRKRDYRRMSHNFSNNIKPCNASSPVKPSGFRFKDIAQVKINQPHIISPITKGNKFTFKDIAHEGNQTGKKETITNTSTSKISMFKFGKQEIIAEKNVLKKQISDESKASTKGNVFDRLYELRPRPCPGLVSLVQHIREAHTTKSLANKQSPKTVCCASHEPPCKKRRYSKECLNGALNKSVFERLYAERKQLNTKKLTDIQKRELYLKKQREDLKVEREKRAKQQLDHPACRCESSLESPTSDYDQNDFMTSDSEASDICDSTKVNLNDSAVDMYKPDTSSKDELFNSTITPEDDEYDSPKVQQILDSLATRFHQHMSLCPIYENDLLN